MNFKTMDYIQTIRNPNKKEYALAYNSYLQGRLHNDPTPLFKNKLGFMARQDVEMNLHKLLGPTHA